jgi:hypothetical protein
MTITINLTRKKLAALAAVVALLSVGVVAAAHKVEKPKSVIHVVTVKWNEGATQQQIKAALDGVEEMGEKYPGIKRVWLRSIKVQDPTPRDPKNPNAPRISTAFVMEFESEESLKNYTDSEAQKEWYKIYLPIRAQSVTHDITN